MTGSNYSPLQTVRVTLTVWCISSFFLYISICLVLLLPASFLAIFIAAFFKISVFSIGLPCHFSVLFFVSLNPCRALSCTNERMSDVGVSLEMEPVISLPVIWRACLGPGSPRPQKLLPPERFVHAEMAHRCNYGTMYSYICTYWLHTHTHTHAHTPPILLLTLTDWCLPVSQGVGVRTILCNWIPVATVYLPPSSSLWQQSLTYSQSLLKSVCFLHVFDFLSKSPFYMLLSTCLLSNPLVSFSLKCSVLPVHAFHRFQNGVHV